MKPTELGNFSRPTDDASATPVEPSRSDTDLQALVKMAFPDAKSSGIAAMIPEIETVIRTGTYEQYLTEVKPVWLKEQCSLAESAAEGKCDLIEALAKEHLTEANEQLWIRLVEGLKPGPYSDLVCEHLEAVDITGSEVRSKLIDISKEWESYENNLSYKSHLDRLDNVISGGRSEGFGDQLRSVVGGVRSLLGSLLPDFKAPDEEKR